MVLTANGNHVTWFIDRPDIYRHVRRYGRNPHYLPAVEFDLALISPSDSIRSAVEASDIIIMVTPAAYLKAALEGLADDDLVGKTLCSGIKGIIPGDNCVTGEYLVKRYMVPDESIVIITGPSHAEEVSTEKLTYLTFASLNSERAESVASLFSNRWIKTLLSGDYIGIEYAAVMKNIYAIAAGITNGLGYGDNFVAVLLANAAGEMNRFVNVVSPYRREITESPYLGDLNGFINAGVFRSHDSLRVVYDAFSGAGSGVLDRKLGELGASIRIINGTRDPLFAGREHPEPNAQGLLDLCAEVVKSGASLGVATDGDADRFGIVDENGVFVTPHDLLALLLDYLAESGRSGTAVRSVTTGSLMDRVAAARGIPVKVTPVGFKHLGSAMLPATSCWPERNRGGCPSGGTFPRRTASWLACWQRRWSAPEERVSPPSSKGCGTNTEGFSTPGWTFPSLPERETASSGTGWTATPEKPPEGRCWESTAPTA